MTINSISLNKFENIRTRSSRGCVTPNHQVAFNGVYDRATTGMAKGLGKLADTQFVKKTVGFFNGKSYGSKVLKFVGDKLNIKQKWFQHAVALEGIYVTSCYMYNTKKSKTIPEDQKHAMMTNQALVTTLCTTLAYTIDNKITKGFDKLKRFFTSTNVIKIAEQMKGKASDTKMPLKTASAMANGISKLKSVLVFGFIYRYFSPVFITPIANRVSEFFDKGSKQKSAKKA